MRKNDPSKKYTKNVKEKKAKIVPTETKRHEITTKSIKQLAKAQNERIIKQKNEVKKIQGKKCGMNDDNPYFSIRTSSVFLFVCFIGFLIDCFIIHSNPISGLLLGDRDLGLFVIKL